MRRKDALPALVMGSGLFLVLLLVFAGPADARVQPDDWSGGDSRRGWVRSTVAPLPPVSESRANLELAESRSVHIPRPVLTYTLVPSSVLTSTAVLQLNEPPQLPVLVGPPDKSAGTSLSITLTVSVYDADQDALSVTFYGRQVLDAIAPPFAVVALPDTQYYSCGELCGIDPAIFASQTQWVVDQRLEENIAFVSHLGDVVLLGDLREEEWQSAEAALSLLETPSLPQWPMGTPYGIAVGNHDQFLGTDLFNDYFGVSRFQDKAYYGGHYGITNNNHFNLFSVGNLDFVVVHLEYDETPDAVVLEWADEVLKAHRQRRAIVVSHFLIWPGDPGEFGVQGQAIYDALKHNPNLFLMLCGHHTEEGRRADVFHGQTVHTLLSDYQNRTNGGDGWLRILDFLPANNRIQVRTYSPILDQFETDSDSQFSLPYVMDRSVYEVIVVQKNVASGADSMAIWSGLAPDTRYEWYVAVSDGSSTTIGPTWAFTTTGEAVHSSIYLPWVSKAPQNLTKSAR